MPEANSTASAARPGGAPLPRARLLLVDDDRLVLATLGHGLRSAGFDVACAASGLEALAACESAAPDLLIIDYEMPQLSGVELAETLQQRGPIPFIFLSAYADPEVVERAARAGALSYIVKPVDPPQLVPAIRTALTRAQQTSALRQDVERIGTALKADRDVSVVTGLLMERYTLDQHTAYEKLRSYARGQRRKLVDVAAEILSATDRLRSTLQQVAQCDVARD
jgi:two-component system, response regulator PdtaR